MLRGFGWDSGRVQKYPVESEAFGLQHLRAHSKYWVAPGEVLPDCKPEVGRGANPHS